MENGVGIFNAGRRALPRRGEAWRETVFPRFSSRFPVRFPRQIFPRMLSKIPCASRGGLPWCCPVWYCGWSKRRGDRRNDFAGQTKVVQYGRDRADRQYGEAVERSKKQR